MFVKQDTTYYDNLYILIDFLLYTVYYLSITMIITVLTLVPFLHYSWIISMIACLFLEDDFK